METVGVAFDKLKGFAKSSQDLVDNLIHHPEYSARRNPIEILKRLQREAFSDLMKLRDSQEKVERMLSFHKPSKGSPFQEASTLVRGQVDLLGALLLMDRINQQNLGAISRAGIRTGVDSRFSFETNIRQKDSLVVELVANQKGAEHLGDIQEASTLVRGQVDLLGALLLMDRIDQQNLGAISRAGIRTGVDSRFSFETNIRQKDSLVVELVANQKGAEHLGDIQEASTLVRGQVDLLGALLLMDRIDQQNLDAISRAGIRTGVDSRFTFETTIRQKDSLVVELVASQKGAEYLGDIQGSPLSMAKLSYVANVNDWLSVLTIPLGAQCRDVGNASNSFHPGKDLIEVSSFGPSLLNLHHGSAIGITVRKSNIVASLAQLTSGLGMQPGSNLMENFSSTFGQVVCHYPRGTKLSLLGLHQVPMSSSQTRNVGPLTFPILPSKRYATSETVPEALPPSGTNTQGTTDSLALMVESELDDITKIGGWIEMNMLNPRSVRWAVTMGDVSDNSFGWGTCFSGMVGEASGDNFLAESYLKFDLGNKFTLKPGLAYIMGGDSKTAALMLRSNWSL